MSIEIRPAYQETEQVKELFQEYTKMLMEADSAFTDYLALQNYDDEIENVEKKYGMPSGRLYIAYCDSRPAGCIALRKIDDDCCEMKRLYVRPAFRGKKIAKKLVEIIIHDAIDIGYAYMVLDTLPVLQDAIRLYKAFGFYEIPPYNNSPIEETVFLRLDLNGPLPHCHRENNN